MNQYTLDGVPLRDPALKWFADRETGIRIIPARRTPSQQFPNVDGDIFIPSTPYDPGAVAVNLQVQGSSPEDFRANLEFITGLITQRSKLMVLTEHYVKNENSRQAEVTLATSVEPIMLSKQSALVGATFSVPGVFWRSAALVTDTVAQAVTSSAQTVELEGFKGGNAPITDALFRIRVGAFSTLTIEDAVTGSGFTVNTPLLASETLLVDPVTWKAVIVTGNTVDTWSLNQGRNISGLVVPNHGYGSMVTLEPGLDAATRSFAYRVRVSGTNVSGAPKIEYRAKRSYL